MKRTFVLLGFLALAALAAPGCSKRYKVEIQSDTCWSGSFDDGQAIFDCGNATYRVIGTFRCVRLQKGTDTGYLRARVDGGAWTETSDPRGIVQVCR